MARDALVGAGGMPLSADILGHLLESSQDVLYAVALDPVHMLYATPAFARRMGLPEDYLARGYAFGEYLQSVHPDDQGRVAEGMGTIVASRSDADLPKNPACYRLRTPEGGWRTIEDTYRILRDADGVPHTLIGNARDVSEQRETRRALAENEAHFSILAENSRDLFFSMRFPEGRFDYLSPSYAEVTGFSPEEHYADPGVMFRVIAPDWREPIARWLEDIRRGNVAESYEFQIVDRLGRLRWLHQRQVLVPAPDGRGMLLQGVATDVTDLRQVQQALAENEARFRSLAENSRDIFFTFRVPEGRYEFISPKVVDLLGHTAQDFYADPGLFMRCVAPAWRETMAGWNAEIAQGQVHDKYEFEVLDKHGRLRWLVERLVLVPAPDGQGLLLQGVAADITEERGVREALRASEEHFRQLIEAWPEQVMLSVNLTAGRHEYVSPSMERVMGYASQEFYDDPGLGMRVVAPQWQQQAWEWIAEIKQGIVRPAYEFELVHKNGEHRWIHQVGVLRPHAPGQDLLVQFTFRDITEERGAREALRASEERYRELAEGWLNQVVIRFNLHSGRYEYVSPGMENVFGFAPEEFYRGERSMVGRTVAPEWRETVQEWLAEARGGALRPEYEFELIDASGARRWVRQHCTLLHAADGTPEVVQGVLYDNTERKRLEEELCASRAFLECVIEQSPMSMWISDETGMLIRSNQALRKLFQVSEEDVVGRFNIFQDNQALEHGFMPQIRRVYEQGGTTRFMLPYDTARIEGLELSRSATAFLDVTISAVQDAQGKTTNLIIQHLDISEHMRTEAALRESEERFREVVEGTQSLITQVDGEGRFTYVNPMVRVVLGLEPEDCIGRLAFEIIHPDDREATMAAFQGWVADRLTHTSYENRLVSVFGEVRHFSWSIRFHYDGQGNTTVIDSIARDITEQKRAEEALASKDALLRAMLRNLPFDFWARDITGWTIMQSEESLRLWGNLASGPQVEEALDEGTLAIWRETDRQAMARTPLVAERSLRLPSGETRDYHSIVAQIRDDETALGLLGINIDITERKAAEEALRASEERFRLIVETATEGIWTVDAQERATFVNAAMTRMLGYTAQEMLGVRTEAFLFPEDMEAHTRRMEQRRAGQDEIYERRFLRKDGTTLWTLASAKPLLDDAGRFDGAFAMFVDITERKRIDEALRETNARYSLLAENVVDVIWTTDAALRWTYVSPSVEKLSGYPLARFMAMPFEELFTPEAMRQMGELMARRQKAATRDELDEPYRVEIDLRHANGSLVPLEVLVRPMRGPGGEPIGYCGTSRDITERRRAEKALWESNTRNQLIVETANEGIMTIDVDKRITYCNKVMIEMLGYAEQELYQLLFSDLFFDADIPRHEAEVTRRMSGLPSRFERRFRRHDGTELWTIFAGTPILNEAGTYCGAFGMFTDITERRRAEAALHLSEARYALALRGANDGIWDWDLLEDKVYYSDRWKEIIGYGPDELEHDPQEWISRIHPEDFDRVMAANEGCMRGEAPIFQVEYRLRHRDGSYRWIFGRGATLADASGRVVRMAGAHTDITGRKQTEEALFRNERLSRKLLESMHEGVWAVDANRRTTFVNERLCAMLGYASAELMNMSPTDVLEWPQRHVAKSQLSDLEAGYSGATDYVLIRKDGSRFPAHVVSSPVMEEQGRFEGLVCGVVDLTERARMEHDLRRNQARFEALYELSRLTPATEQKLASFTLREAIRLTDSSAGVLFFASEDGQQLVPKAWETGEFMAGGQVPSFPASGPLPWAKVLQSGQPLLINDIGAFAHLVPPGHPPVSRILGVPALDGSRPVAVLGLTGKDEPYTAEDTLQTTLLLDGMWRVVRARRDDERIRASLREKEALLHEVHHRVKNNLQVISSLMDMAGRRLANAEARASLEDLRGKVQAMSLIHAQLHGARGDGGISLERFVRALFHQLRELYSGGLSLSLVVELSDLALGVDQAVPLGLALNEALTNVFKHASSEGRAGKVSIRTGQDAQGQVCILVRDDGPGLPEGFDPGRAQSLGMKLMYGLVCHQLGGKLEVLNCAPPEHSGVEVCICFCAHVAK